MHDQDNQQSQPATKNPDSATQGRKKNRLKILHLGYLSITTVVCLAVAAALILQGLGSAVVASQMLSDTTTERVQWQAEMIAADTAQRAVSAQDSQALEEAFRKRWMRTMGIGSGATFPVAYVLVQSSDRQELMRYAAEDFLPALEHQVNPNTSRPQDAVHAKLAVAEIVQDGGPRVIVGLHLQDVARQRQTLWLRLGLVLAGVLLISLGIGYAATRGRLRPVLAGIKTLTSDVRSVTLRVADASEEIVATSRKQEGNVRQQTGSVEEIAQSMEALTDTARAIANNAETMTQVAEDMSKNVESAGEALESSRTRMVEIVEQNVIIKDRIDRLYEQSEAIISVTDIIEDISDRLDLLALNAALEGSRAGEVGKGFSLVAHEMRRLAENVTGSTQQIKTTVQEIHALVRAALEASQSGNDKTMAGSEGMEKTVDMMQTLFEHIERTTDQARQITGITRQQVSGSQQIALALRDVGAVSTAGMTSAQQVSTAAQELASVAASLSSQMAALRMDEMATILGERSSREQKGQGTLAVDATDAG